MLKQQKMFIILFVLLLAACQPKESSEPTEAPEAIYTSAAQTVAVQLTQNAQKTPSATFTPPATATLAPTISQPSNTAVSTSAPLPTAANTLVVTQDRVEYLAQVPADGSAIVAKQSFKVTWEIKNVGQTTWTTSYSIRFFSGSRIGAGLPNQYPFAKEVLPGETFAITVDFETGAELGQYQSNWVLTNQEGNNFYPLYITINIVDPTVTPTITQTLTPTSTETQTLTP